MVYITKSPSPFDLNLLIFLLDNSLEINSIYGGENILDSDFLPQAWVSNTHAENTEVNGLRLLVDWVTCSFYFAGTLAELCELIGLAELEFVKEERARYTGYTYTYVSDSIQILTCKKEEKFMLNFSGQACRQYEEYSNLNWIYLFSLLLDFFNAKFTRLDIAIDDFKKIYTVNTIRQAVYKKLCVTHLKDWGTNEAGKVETGNDFLTMDSFYIGGISSRYVINVYDKYLERKNKGKELTVDSWTRTEIRFKAEYATMFAINLAQSNESIGYNTMSFLNEKISFLKPGIYDNKSRAKNDKKNVSRWWLKFVGDVGKLKISIKAPDKTIESTKEWLEHSVSPSISLMYHHDPENFNDYINKLIYEGNNKFKQKHISILKNGQKKMLTPKDKGINT